MAGPYIGEIRMFSGNFAPKGWMLCDGQLLEIQFHTALFSILGTTYGGDGRTTFALPDLRSRTPVHQGNGPSLPHRQLGEKFGSAKVDATAAGAGVGQVTLKQDQIPLPEHTHEFKIPCNEADGTLPSPTGNYLAAGENEALYADSSTAEKFLATMKTAGVSPAPEFSDATRACEQENRDAGSSKDTPDPPVQLTSPEPVQVKVNVDVAGPVVTQSPALAVNFIIALVGVYPSRS